MTPGRRARQHAGRAARRGRSHCHAPYGRALHDPADCDAACFASWQPDYSAYEGGRGSVAFRSVMPAWMYLAQEVTAPAEGADFGLTRGMVRLLALIAQEDFARLRAEALAPLLVPLGDRDGSAWARLRAVLESRGLIRPRRDSGPPGLAGEIVTCCPHTGPPALAAALEAPVISP